MIPIDVFNISVTIGTNIRRAFGVGGFLPSEYLERHSSLYLS